jgi:uncharacterized membrane protein
MINAKNIWSYVAALSQQSVLFAIFQLLVSGIMGLLLLCCCHKDYPGMPLGVWMFSLKVRINS